MQLYKLEIEESSLLIVSSLPQTPTEIWIHKGVAKSHDNRDQFYYWRRPSWRMLFKYMAKMSFLTLNPSIRKIYLPCPR